MSHRSLLAGLALCLLLAETSPASAQEITRDRSISPSIELAPVVDLDLLSSRQDGPPVLVLTTGEKKVRPAAGTYRTDDRKALVIEDGRIVEFSDAESRLRLSVVNVDEVAVRQTDAPSRLFVKDSRGRSAALPDGRFVSESGATLVVRDGMIVEYGGGR